MIDSVSSTWTARFRRLLLGWYDRNRRSLPWRNTSDPYPIWISEIMLQQTQVATVIDYYQRFLARFPDVGTLAAAHEQEVLKFWAGLGYYRRALQLHAAAKIIVADFDSKFPSEIAAVQSLPGIGRYTAGAIVSFSFGTRAPILEANTTRLYSRLIGLRDDPRLASSQKQLWHFAESILPSSGTGQSNSGRSGSGVARVNQAAMELGSLVCLPKEPNCGKCPVASLCSAFGSGQQRQIPVAPKPQVLIPMTHVSVIVRARGKFLIRQNPQGGWWAGLWDFPRVDITGFAKQSRFESQIPSTAANLILVEQAMRQELGLDCRALRHLHTIKHGVTRFRISLFCFESELVAGARLPRQSCWRWIALRQDAQIPLSSTARKISSWMQVNRA